MIKLLKILSLLMAAVAVGAIVMLVMFGWDNKTDVSDFLGTAGVVEQHRAKLGDSNAEKEQISPLVKFAKLFALRIDPPPPKIVKPVKTPTKDPVTKIPKDRGPKPPEPKAAINAKFNLVATCVYPDEPEKSLALIDVTSKGTEWVKVGDTVGYLTIQEIHEGKAILFKNGAYNSEIKMTVEKQMNPLLAALTPDAEPISRPGIRPEIRANVPNANVSKNPKNAASDAVSIRKAPATPPKPRTGSRFSPSSAVKAARKAPTSRAVATSRKVPKPAAVTAAEAKKAAEDSVKGIEAIMKDSSEAEAAMFKQLLLMMKDDGEGAAPAGKKTPPAKKK